MTDLLHELNAAQRRAVQAVSGPVLVLAGPGSGKTRVLTHRVGYLVQTLNMEPWRIMAVTFTNKAAREMKERLLQQEVVRASSGGGYALSEAQLRTVTVGTFHSICTKILRQNIERLSPNSSNTNSAPQYDSNFVIFDMNDQFSLMKQILQDHNIDSKRFAPRSLLSRISKAKNELTTAEKYRADDYPGEIVKRVYEQYEIRLQQNNALDFDDLLLKTHQLLRRVPDVLAAYQEKYVHVLVDEFQDTNMVQYGLVRMVADLYRNLFVVGDEDQSIYSWRGADYRNVLRFKEDYPDATTILLEQNYRSTETILETAGSIIAQNRQRHEKALFTEQGKGMPVVRMEAFNGEAEAQFVIDEILRLKQEVNINPAEIAIMYRTNAQSRSVEEAFIRANIPYRLIRGLRFYERKEVKDTLAYLRLIHNPQDSVSLLRVINVPARGIGKKSLETLRNWAARLDITLWQALQLMYNLEKGGLPPHNGDQGTAAVEDINPFAKRASTKLIAFTDILLLLVAAKEKMPLTDLIDLTLAQTGYRAFIQDGTDEGEDRWANIQELKTVARNYDHLSGPTSLASFLENIALASDADALDSAEVGPALLTLHTAKGLEFSVVFMVGMEDGIFPHSRSRDDPEQMEEERRLAYVGVTRAKNRLYLTHAFRRAIYGYDETPSTPSPFLNHIPADLVEVRRLHSGEWRDDVSRGDDDPDSSSMDQYSRGRTRYAQQTQWKGPAGSSSAPRRQTASRVAKSEATKDRFSTGMQVSHAKFGRGTVITVDGSEQDAIITVAFPGKGIKKLLGSYLKVGD